MSGSSPPGGTLCDETFEGPDLRTGLTWYNPPRRWRIDGERGGLVVEPDPRTDFWQKTHYGFSADNGHLLYLEVEGDFTAETEVRYRFAHQYDQAGLMVRISRDDWIKATAEYEPEENSMLGVVVTRDGYSDWSTQELVDESVSLGLRVVRTGADYLVSYRYGAAGRWSQLRMTHLKEARRVRCGLFACCPRDEGFVARFSRFSIVRGAEV
jgi:regulation of enolase protein 1 (concanavalin A-like superfamily)